MISEWNPFFKKGPKNLSQSGMTIAGMMIAAAIACLLGIIILKVSINGYNSMRNNEIKTARLELRSQILNQFDCAATMATESTACNSHDYIELKSKMASRPILIANQSISGGAYTKIGEYSLRARCAACPICTNNSRIVVDYAAFQGSSTSTFKKNPFTGAPLSWTELFPPEIPFGCSVPPPTTCWSGGINTIWDGTDQFTPAMAITCTDTGPTRCILKKRVAGVVTTIGTIDVGSGVTFFISPPPVGNSEWWFDRPGCSGVPATRLLVTIP